MELLKYLIKGHKSAVTTLLRLSDDKIISGGADGLIKIWDIDFATCLRIIIELPDQITCSLILDHNHFIIGDENQISIINIETGEVVNTLNGHSDNITCLLRMNDD